MDFVRIGVIGIGNIGTAHANCIYNGGIDGMKLTAVCDISAARREYCRSNFGNISVYADYKEMLKSGIIDAVIIAVPHKLHCDIAAEAFDRGINVLSEKPIDITVSKAHMINEKSKESNKVFAVMFNQRTNDVYCKAREIVKGGKIGELKRTVWIITNWYRTQKYYNSGDWRATWSGEGGGVLLNQAPHNLDLWQWICGMPSEITAFCDTAKYHDIEVEDDVTIFARYKNGATGTFLTSTGEYPGTNRLEISGTLGKIVLEDNVLKWWKLPCDERDFCICSNESFPSLDTEYEEYKSETQKKDGHSIIIQNFADAILKNEELISPGIEGINELTISNAAYLSEWTGNKPVSIPFDTEKFDSILKEKQKNTKNKSKAEKSDGNEAYSERWKVKW